MRQLLIFVTLFLMFASHALAADSKGKISGYMFGDCYYILKNHDASIQEMNGVQFRRIYFTYDQKLSDQFTTRLRIEFNNAGDFPAKRK